MSSTPQAMRQSVARYVEAIHAAYVDESRSLPPAERARLPLLAAGRFWVAAVAAGDLHLVATEEPLSPVDHPEATHSGSAGPLSWTVCFYDPVALPALASVPSPSSRDVHRLIGVTTSLYHLTLSPGAELTPHRAMHTGIGLVATHAAEVRALEVLRRVHPHDHDLIDEILGAGRAGLCRAQVLLAHSLLPDDEALAALARQRRPDPHAVRDAILAAARRCATTR